MGSLPERRPLPTSTLPEGATGPAPAINMPMHQGSLPPGVLTSADVASRESQGWDVLMDVMVEETVQHPYRSRALKASTWTHIPPDVCSQSKRELLAYTRYNVGTQNGLQSRGKMA